MMIAFINATARFTKTVKILYFSDKNQALLTTHLNVVLIPLNHYKYFITTKNQFTQTKNLCVLLKM